MQKDAVRQSKKDETNPQSIPADIIRLTVAHTDYFVNLVQVFQQAFHLGDIVTPRHYLQQLLSNQNYIVFVAIQSNQVIGGLTAHVLHSYHLINPDVYLYDLAVHADWQRRGVGKCLLSALTQYCKGKGFNEIFVQAETDDANALAFYRHTPVCGETGAIQFYYKLMKE